MGSCFIFNTTGTHRAWTIESMIESMIAKVRKVHPKLGQSFHSMPIATTAETRFWTYTLIDFIFENLYS